MKRLIVFALMAVVALPTTTHAFKIQRSVISSGATESSNATTKLRGTLGQPVVGASASGNEMTCHGFWCVVGIPVVSVPGPDPGPAPDLPHTLSFSQPQPNPARAHVTFQLALPTDAVVKLTVYDVAGRTVTQAPVSRLNAGHHVMRWDGRGQGVGPGVYFARLDVDGRNVGTRRIVMVR